MKESHPCRADRIYNPEPEPGLQLYAPFCHRPQQRQIYAPGLLL